MAEKKAIIISTHILEEVDAVCSRAVIIAKGRLLFSGSPGELAAHSAYYNAVTMRVASAMAATVTQTLGTLPGVARVESMTGVGDRTTITAIPEDNTSIVGTIHECARALNWQLDELFVESGRLDEVFRTITVGGRSEAEEMRT